MWLLIRSLFWTIVLPGFLAGYVPLRYFGLNNVRFDALNPRHVLGLFCIAVGCVLLGTCIFEFARSGRGTLSPVDPPRHLVVRGLYRYVRNPMYLSVTIIVLGEVLVTGSPALAVYGAIWFLCANLFVIGYEEPTLRRHFGASYDDYRQRIGRWIPGPARVSVPRALARAIALIVWPALMVGLNGLVPAMISELTDRHGWAEGRPGFWNAGGLTMVVAGSALLVWTLAAHLAHMPARVRVELKLPWEFTPPYLVASGPYRSSRHPMYVAVLVLWLGWAVFYGSASIVVACLAIVVLINLMARREERALEACFGEAYTRYKAAVPRWFGKERRRTRAAV
jgi:protein-S-isoprenylcysteine O-methyltransferase Ste14